MYTNEYGTQILDSRPNFKICHCLTSHKVTANVFPLHVVCRIAHGLGASLQEFDSFMKSLCLVPIMRCSYTGHSDAQCVWAILEAVVQNCHLAETCQSDILQRTVAAKRRAPHIMLWVMENMIQGCFLLFFVITVFSQ